MKKLIRLPLSLAMMLWLDTVAFANAASENGDSGYMVSAFGKFLGIPAVILIVIAVLVCYFQRRKK